MAMTSQSKSNKGQIQADCFFCKKEYNFGYICQNKKIEQGFSFPPCENCGYYITKMQGQRIVQNYSETIKEITDFLTNRTSRSKE